MMDGGGEELGAGGFGLGEFACQGGAKGQMLGCHAKARRREGAKKTGVRFAPFEALPLRVHFLLSSPPLHSKRAITHP